MTKFKFILEIDLEEALLNNDAEPFCDYTESDYENHLKKEVLKKVEEIEIDTSVVITVRDEYGKML